MPVASLSLQTSRAQWSFSAITNTFEARGRKRSHNEEDGVKKLGESSDSSLRRITKKPRLAEGLVDVSRDDSRFVPQLQREAEGLDRSREDPDKSGGDVARIISLLLHTLNTTQGVQEEEARRVDSTPPRPSPYRRLPTSPLSNSPDRAPFIRKTVGGARQGCVEPGLQKWVLTKNLVEDVQAFHPSYRSPEWIEALHEMGWENYHPKYTIQCDNYIAIDHDLDDWVEVDVGQPGGYWRREDGPSGQIFLH